MIDPNTTVSAIGEGAKAIIGLESIVQKVFGPHWAKKQADADAYADEKRLQTIRNNPDMEIVYANGQMNARIRTPEALAYRAEQRYLSDSIRQENNIENILDVVAKELAGIETASDNSVDDDWITRFFSIAKDINTEDMQFVWGKILAGEIISPGSFSLRTLDTIKNLSRKDAELFERIMPFVCYRYNDYFICSDAAVLQKYGIDYTSVLHLDECGLVNSAGTIQLHLFHKGQKKDYIQNTKQIMILSSADGADTPFGIHPLKSAGTELFNVLLHNSNLEYFGDLAQHIFSRIKGSTASVSVHEINYTDGDNINYSEERIFDFSK